MPVSVRALSQQAGSAKTRCIVPVHIQLATSTLRTIIKERHYPPEVMLVCVHWYTAYPLSLRGLEEMMAERGMVVDHATVHRWVVKMLSVLAAVIRARKRPVGPSWRMHETYIEVGGQWKYLYRAVDTAGQTMDFLLRAHCDYAAARCFFERAIDPHGVPAKITIDKSGANTAAIEGIRADSGAGVDAAIEVPRQSHRAGPSGRQTHRAPYACFMDGICQSAID